MTIADFAEKERKKDYIYNIYILYIEEEKKKKRIQTNFNCPSGLWSEVKKVLEKTRPGEKYSRSDLIIDMLANFCLSNGDTNQKKLNVFIDTPQIVNIEKGNVVIRTGPKPIDYSGFSVDNLAVEYLKSDTTRKQIILFELKKRGVNIRDFQRRTDK